MKGWFPVEDGLCGLGVVHAVDSGSRGEHALSRHLRAARKVEHLVDAVQVGGIDVEQGSFPGRKSDLIAGIQVGIIFITCRFQGRGSPPFSPPRERSLRSRTHRRRICETPSEGASADYLGSAVRN